MNRREAYDMLRAFGEGGVTLSASTVQELAVIIYDAARSAGESWVTENAQAALDPQQRQRFVDRDYPGELRDMLWRLSNVEMALPQMAGDHARRIELVSEGAQRDSLDLHKRLTEVEKRLMPPNPEDSWALPLANEVGASLERLEKEQAAIRNDMAGQANDRSWMLNTVRASDARSLQATIETQKYQRQVTQLQQQFDNLRKKLKALLT